jgi:hypothetical protein
LVSDVPAGDGKNDKLFLQCTGAGSEEKFMFVRWEKVDDVRKNIKRLAGKRFPTSKNTAGSAGKLASEEMRDYCTR